MARAIPVDGAGRPEDGLIRKAKENVIRVAPGRYRLRGELSFVTAGPLLRTVLAALRDAKGTVTIDLAEIERVDSAGVALLIELVRVARQRGFRLCFANLSPQLEALAAVSGVERLLARVS